MASKAVFRTVSLAVTSVNSKAYGGQTITRGSANAAFVIQDITQFPRFDIAAPANTEWTETITRQTLMPEPTIPDTEGYSLQNCTIRRQWVEEFTGTKMPGLSTWWHPDCNTTTEHLRGHIEAPIGTIQIPVAVAGPMLINGTEAKGWFLAPMATTEGALIASLSRGAKAISLAGGVETWATQQRITRAPMFVCGTPLQAVALGDWMRGNVDRIQREAVAKSSNEAQLKEIMAAYDEETCHVLLRFETGDAAGQNMTTSCSWETAKWINEHAPRELGIDITNFSIDGPLSSNKKACSFNALMGTGISVTARAYLPEPVLRNVLGIDSATLLNTAGSPQRISNRTGSLAGLNANVANVLGGMFPATGQDIASVHESAVGRFDLRRPTQSDSEGGVIASIYLPSLVVGTVGGATTLPTQNECLRIMGCEGRGKVRRLAEIIAGFCLALDISTYSAVIAGEFADAHDRLGRNRPQDKEDPQVKM